MLLIKQCHIIGYTGIDVQFEGIQNGAKIEIYFVSWAASSEFGTYRLCEQ